MRILIPLFESPENIIDTLRQLIQYRKGELSRMEALSHEEFPEMRQKYAKCAIEPAVGFGSVEHGRPRLTLALPDTMQSPEIAGKYGVETLESNGINTF